MAGAIIAPALPQIKEHFSHLPEAEFLTQLMLTVPGITIALGAPLVGYLIDRFGRKKLLIISLVLYGFTGTAGYSLDNLYHILISRALLGLAVAGIMTITNTLTADYFEGKERNNFVSLRSSFVALGGVFFVGAAGFLADIGWRVPFLVYFFSFLLLPLVVWVIYEPEVQKSDPHRAGQQVDYPRFWIRFVYFIAFLGMSLFYLIPVNVPFVLTEVIGVKNSVVGLSIAGSMLAAATSAGFYARLKNFLNFNALYALCFFLMSLGFLIVSQSSTYWFVLLGMICVGSGVGLIGPNHALCLMNSAPPELRGRILGSLSTFVFLGQFTSPFLGKFALSLNGSLSFSFALYGIIMLIIATGFTLGSLKKT